MPGTSSAEAPLIQIPSTESEQAEGTETETDTEAELQTEIVQKGDTLEKETNL